MKQFEVLLGKIRTAEVRDAIASVRAWCGRGMAILAILVGIALLGVAALSIVSGRVAKDESLLLEDVNDLRLHDVRGDAELEVLKARVEEVEFYHASVDTRLG